MLTLSHYKIIGSVETSKKISVLVNAQYTGIKMFVYVNENIFSHFYPCKVDFPM